MIELRAVPGKTGRLLRELLEEKGLNLTQGNVEAIVSYGCRVKSDLPTLNGNAGTRNKFEELQQLRKRNVSVVPFTQMPVAWRDEDDPMMLGRSFQHKKGRDIRFYKNYAAIPHHHQHQFFTEYIPQIHEYRVWVFRGKCLGVYQKLQLYPKKAIRNRKRGRASICWNWDNGYAFKFFKDAPAELQNLGIRAIRALDLDFGAVDILQAEKDKKYYVLEVNCAPGTQGPRQGLTYLATKIARWCQNGFKKRNEWKEGQ